MSTGVARVNDAASLVHRSKQVGLDIVKPSGTGFRFFPWGIPQIDRSMSRRGDCRDNAVVESAISHLKRLRHGTTLTLE
jgi:hypothetical protein